MSENFISLLKKHKLRVTQARLGILKALEGAKQPVDIEDLSKALSRRNIAVDKVTVYRGVEVLVKTGIAKQVDFREGKLRYELDERHHHHLVCSECGDIQAVYGDNLRSFEKKISDQYKFMVREHALEFFGVCRSCQESGVTYV